jgi:hypothetical protein
MSNIHPFLANLLRKDQADATPFALSVGAPTAMSSAVTKADLVGGVLRPYRVFRNVGSTLIGATVREGQNATIMDVLALGMVYSITSVRLKTIALPGVSTTITIKANGSTIFTKTLLLANISAVGALTDLLGIGTVMPVDLTLPATLTCSASSGTFDIIVDGLLN